MSAEYQLRVRAPRGVSCNLLRRVDHADLDRVAHGIEGPDIQDVFGVAARKPVAHCVYQRSLGSGVWISGSTGKEEVNVVTLGGVLPGIENRRLPDPAWGGNANRDGKKGDKKGPHDAEVARRRLVLMLGDFELSTRT